ncbi:ArsR/SmtB family transcription factor [Streptomyces sp. YH02]|uniref:ArsR/SmtB family transcription factor n=1 Tax=Streptomyces sp. YH02 TaxID=3256999 RepID=UPI00375701DA
MIRLQIDDQSLHSVRLAYSPLWEALGSIALLARYRGEVPSPYTQWARRVRQGMPPELNSGLVDLMRGSDPEGFPQTFIHVPGLLGGTLSEELAHAVGANSMGPPGERLADLLQQYWNWAIAPYWTSIRSVLEEEVLFRGRTFAVAGPEAMLGELVGRMDWSKPYLTAPYHRDVSRDVLQSQLTLVPMVFAGGLRIITGPQQEAVALSYQARATGFLHALPAGKPGTQKRDRLTLLLGKGRAQVLRSLEVPKTTTMIAATLGMAKSTVSQHLSVLTQAGLVWRQRVGGRVFYQIDRDGFVVLEHLGS